MEERDYINEVIQKFFEQFAHKPDLVYFEWKPEPKLLGKVVDFIIDAINNKPR